jgi:hypothetical protein
LGVRVSYSCLARWEKNTIYVITTKHPFVFLSNQLSSKLVVIHYA